MKLNAPFTVNEEVWDILTAARAKVIGIEFLHGKVWRGKKQTDAMACWGIWLDNKYLDGGRHPWEVEKYPLPKE